MKEAKKALDNIQRMVLGGVAKCMRTTPLMSCETLLGFPPLDLWIRKVAFKVTSMKSQLALRANGLVAVLTVGDTGPCCTRSLLKKMVLRKPYEVIMREKGAHTSPQSRVLSGLRMSKMEKGAGVETGKWT